LKVDISYQSEAITEGTIMGKYDNIFESDDVSEELLSPEQAVAAIAIVIAAADTSLDKLDIDNLAYILSGFEVFEEYSDDDLLETIDKLIAIAVADKVGGLFNIAVDALPDDLVLDGYAAGVSVLIDEEKFVVKNERMPLLKQLQEVLDVDDEEAQEVLQEVITAFEEAESEAYLEEDETIIADFHSEVYESPLGNFTVPIPVSPDKGGKVQSQDGLAGFSDDFGILLRIDYYHTPPEQVGEMESLGQEQYFRSILLDKYIPQAIVANFPTATVEYTVYLTDELAGAFYALVNMPGGSTISKQENNGHAKRFDAYRGILTFMEGDFIYIVSSQRSFFEDDTPNSVDEEAQAIMSNILDFIDTIEFD
jgi:hypothetical protein